MAKQEWTPWCVSHYRHEFCLEKAKELRGSGEYEKVRIGSTIKEHGKKFSKIFVIEKKGVTV